MAAESVGTDVLSRFGTAKIAGFTCNKRSPVTIRIDLEVRHENVGNALSALGLEATEELVTTLESTLAHVRKHVG